jgi:addiction module HigA family antidote
MSKSEGLQAPVHPGEVLLEDFMKPLVLTANRLALELHVPATRIGEIVHERRRITAETALRLARYFRTNAEFWLNLQNFYDWKYHDVQERSLRSNAKCTPLLQWSLDAFFDEVLPRWTAVTRSCSRPRRS